MKKLKLIVGLSMLVISATIFKQIASTNFKQIFYNRDNSRLIAFVVAISYLSAGIVYLLTRRQTSLDGDILSASILGCSGFISFITADTLMKHLTLWIILGFIIGFGILNWRLITKKSIKHEPILTGPYPTREEYRKTNTNK